MTEEAPTHESMPINPTRAKQLAENIAGITSRIQAASKGRDVRLVAVSKLKPANDILALHSSPTSHQHFGENYLQELQEKARLLPPSIKWHFIGGLQSNKCQPLASSIPNLYCVSSIDSIKKANALEKGRAELVAANSSLAATNDNKLNIHVQVNTSGEPNKSGVSPNAALELCQHIRDHCPHLRLAGLMTIGALARSKATTPETENEDFISLRTTRDQVAEALGVGADQLELSMGMSEDFEGAVRLGSDEVRVGSTIFGERPLRKDAKIKEEGGEEVVG